MTTFYGILLKATGQRMAIETEVTWAVWEISGYKQSLVPRDFKYDEELYLTSDKKRAEFILTSCKHRHGEYWPTHKFNEDELEIFEVNIG